VGESGSEPAGEGDVEETGAGDDEVELAVHAAGEHPVHAECGAEADERGERGENAEHGDGGLEAGAKDEGDEPGSGEPDYGTAESAGAAEQREIPSQQRLGAAPGGWSRWLSWA
jgi:hypothetical protein